MSSFFSQPECKYPSISFNSF